MSKKLKLYKLHEAQLYMVRVPPNVDLQKAMLGGWRTPEQMCKKLHRSKKQLHDSAVVISTPELVHVPSSK